jgi:DNA-binding response OmpR family regulator
VSIYTESVLIIDDDKVFAGMMSQFLKMHHWEVCVAHDGEAGLDLYRACHPSIVLLDINLPKMDGLAVLEYFVKEDHINPADIIVMSNRNDMDIVSRVMELGVKNYLVKVDMEPSSTFEYIKKELKRKNATS